MPELQSPESKHSQTSSPFDVHETPEGVTSQTAVSIGSASTQAHSSQPQTATKPARPGDIDRALGHWADNGDAKGEPSSAKSGKKQGFQPVEKDGFLQRSDSDPTRVGLRFHNQWMVAVSGGKPVAFADAVVGALRVAKDVTVLEVQAATPADSGWKLQGEAIGLLIEGSLAAPVAVSEVGHRANGGWQLHGKHGARDKLPQDVEAVMRDDDQIELHGMDAPAIWMTYPVGKEANNPGGWATTGHSKGQIAKRRSELGKDAANLADPLKQQVQGHLDVMAVVSSIEGGYGATSGQVADTSGSLGIFQWARPRDPDEGPDSIDRMFERMKKRADDGAEKVKNKQSPSPEEDLAMKAWKQTQERGVGVENHHTTYQHGTAAAKPASGLDLELAMAKSSGLEDAGGASRALLDSANIKDRLHKVHDQTKGKPAEDQKKEEIRHLDRLLQQLTAVCKDVLGSDLVGGKDEKDSQAKIKLETILGKLAPPAKAVEKEKAGPKPAEAQEHPAGQTAEKTTAPASKLIDPAAELDKQIQDKTALIREADKAVRPIIDRKIQSAHAMATDDMRKYQLLAALDTIQGLQSKPVYLEHQDYYPGFCPGIRTPNSGTVELPVDGRILHMEHRAALVGQFLKSEKALAAAVSLGVNRPAYVATALWMALQSGDAGARAAGLARSVFAAYDSMHAGEKPAGSAGHADAGKTAAKKSPLRESEVAELLKSPPPELSGLAAQAQSALGELKGIFWPDAGSVDEDQLLTRFRQEAMRIYNTRESKDASDNNRIGRFVTVELVDWEAVDAVKNKQ